MINPLSLPPLGFRGITEPVLPLQLGPEVVQGLLRRFRTIAILYIN
jgi:hypothetical protein